MKSHYRELWQLTRGQRRRYGVALGALAIGIVLTFLVPLAVRQGIDRMATGGGPAAAALPALAVVGLSALGALFLYLKGRWTALAAEDIARALRDRLYHRLERLPLAYFDRAETGDLMQRCTSDVETLRLFLANQAVEVGRVAMMLLVVVPILLWLDPPLTLVSLAVLPLVLGFALVFFRRIADVFRAADEAEGEMTAVLQENLSGIRVVRAFAREAHEIGRFAERNARHRDRSMDLLRLLAVYWSVSDLLCFSQTGAILLYGAARLEQGAISVGTLFAFLSYAGLVIWPLRQLGRLLTDLSKTTVALERLGHILAEPTEEETDRGLRLEPAPGEGAIEARDLSFAYPAGARALDRLSFSVRPGETLAIVGPPGSGKTTLASLLLRLYDYQKGSLRLDGVEVRDLDRRALRDRIGVALQEPFLYSRTVSENLRLARPEATEQDLVESATASCIHDAIASFDRGYETLVGERGVTLSGGQRQRLALARLLLKDPPVLILDDALSAVDSRTEGRIRAALHARRGRRTTLLIAHRLSTIVHADRILVLDHGRLAQIGSHTELATREGPYRRLLAIQGELDQDLQTTSPRPSADQPAAAAGA